MAVEWICYLDNQEFGPISEPDLMELLREGTVPVNTYIRRPTDTSWTTVQDVFGPDVLKRQELSPRPALTPTSESKMFTDSPTLVNLPAESGEDWYWYVLGETFGPGTLGDIAELSERGLISADDFIRLGQHGEWMKAGSIDSLFPASKSFVDAPGTLTPPPPPAGMNNSSPPASLETHSPAMLADETKLLQQLLELLQNNPNLNLLARATPASQQSAIPPDQQWFCMVSGQQVGPVTIETLVQMVLQGRIFPGDLIRLGNSGEWFPASSVEGLFPKVAPSQSTAASDSIEETPSKVSIENLRKTPESDLVIQGLERLYKASEEAASILAEKEMKAAAQQKEPGAKQPAPATNPAASRTAATDIIKNYSQFALTSAEKKKKEAEANKLTFKEQLAANKKNLITVGIFLLLMLGLAYGVFMVMNM